MIALKGSKENSFAKSVGVVAKEENFFVVVFNKLPFFEKKLQPTSLTFFEAAKYADIRQMPTWEEICLFSGYDSNSGDQIETSVTTDVKADCLNLDFDSESDFLDSD